ncbi:hypothetical protein PCE1_003167 [Barthelona sp. PCE]
MPPKPNPFSVKPRFSFKANKPLFKTSAQKAAQARVAPKPKSNKPSLTQVTINSGEENENVVYAEHGKLYRFHEESNSWRERAQGVIKILQHKTTQKFRVIMRRDQIYKVGLNHALIAGMTIRFKPNSDKILLWACKDHSDESEGVPTRVCLRLKEETAAANFKRIFENACSENPTAVATINPEEVAKFQVVENPEENPKEETASAAEPTPTEAPAAETPVKTEE